MTASRNNPLELEIGDRNECPVAAGQRLFQGACVFKDAAGRATAVVGPFLGHAAAEADNRNGGAGAINVLLHSGPYRAQVTISSVALTDIGKEVFASADDTYALTANGGANALVGFVKRYVTTNTAVVEFIPVHGDLITVVEQAHIADTKANYAAADVQTDGTADGAKIATALNTLAQKINAILASNEAAGVNASS